MSLSYQEKNWQSDIFPVGYRYPQLARAFEEIILFQDVPQRLESHSSAWEWSTVSMRCHSIDCDKIIHSRLNKNRLDKQWMDMGAWKFRLTSTYSIRKKEEAHLQLSTMYKQRSVKTERVKKSNSKYGTIGPRRYTTVAIGSIAVNSSTSRYVTSYTLDKQCIWLRHVCYYLHLWLYCWFRMYVRRNL